MSIAVAIKHMMAAGMTPEAIVEAVAEMEEACVQPETAKDRKREADRIRIATKRDKARHDATSRDNATPLCPPNVFPQTPFLNPPIIPHATLLNASASDLNGLEAKCRQAANAENNPSPSLFDLSRVIRCLTAGASLELDVLPAIRQITVRGHRWSSWKYAEQAIMDAKANREAPAKPGNATIAQPRSQSPPGKVSNNRRILDALNAMEPHDVNFATSHNGPVQISTSRPVLDV